MKRYMIIAAAALLMVSCSDWTKMEDVDLQGVKERSDEYYAALRAYKATDHQIAFGWFGHWDPDKPSPSNSFKSAPDSLDILSLWGWGLKNPEYTQAKLDDIKYIQDVRGTKVTATILLQWLDPEKYTYDLDGVEKYAEDVAAKIIEQGLLGLDIDWEPGITGYWFDFQQEGWMSAFTKVVGKYFGPKSGTDRLLLIDGTSTTIASNGNLPQELREYFDYAIFQTYETGGVSGTANSAMSYGWLPEQIIFTETFERRWNDGGYLKQQAEFQPTVMVDGVPKKFRKGGVGVYHMEYDYNNSPDYKWFSQAIQIMNPAGEKHLPAGEIAEEQE